MTAAITHGTSALAQVRLSAAAIDGAANMAVESLGEHELPEVLREVAALEARVAALRLAVLAEADRRQIAQLAAATGTDAWAARLVGTSRGVMSGGIWLARLLRDRYSLTREAFADGGINEAQARVIVKAAEEMPREVNDEQRRAAEAGLVAKAVNGSGPRGLRQAGRRMLEVVNRDLADRHEADQLRREEDRAEVETYLMLWDNADGTLSGKFTLPELHGQMLRAALDRLTAPRRQTRNRAGQPVVDDTLPGDNHHGLNRYEQLGVAFTELIEHLPTDGHPPVAATLLVQIEYAHLLQDLAAARLDTGTRISPSEARRLACGAGLMPAVMGSSSLPLDLGRSTRLHTESQRRALSLAHDTCAAEGCDRPFAWTEIHHPHAWSQGGATDLANALPLCGYHHRRAHDHQFTLRRLPTGEVRFRRRTRASPSAQTAA